MKLMSLAWHYKTMSNYFMSGDEKKEIEPIFM